MLSAATVAMLEDLARRSHACFPEGGLLYTFTEAANQAHTKFPREFAKRRTSQLLPAEFARLVMVLNRALGNLAGDLAEAEVRALTETLWQNLQRDLAFTSSGLNDEHNDYSWEATIHLARDMDNRYFSLNLWASVD